MGSFAKSVDSINSWRDKVIVYLLLHFFGRASSCIEAISHISKFP